jgi:hypothetical protein
MSKDLKNIVLSYVHAYEVDLFEHTNKKNTQIIEFVIKSELMREKIATHLSTINKEAALFYNRGRQQFHVMSFFLKLKNSEPTNVYLKNGRAFYAYFSNLIKTDEFPSLYLAEIEESLKLFQRSKCTIDLRLFASYAYAITKFTFGEFFDDYLNYTESKLVNSKKLIREYLKLNEIPTLKTVAKWQINALENLKNYADEEGMITLFRGFTINETDNVRTNRFLKNNPLAHRQDAGRSICYTLDKQIAKEFATSFYDTNQEDSLLKRRINSKSELFDSLKVCKSSFLETTKKRRYVAKYSVPINSVLCSFQNLDEEEILALSSETILVNYRQVFVGQ